MTCSLALAVATAHKVNDEAPIVLSCVQSMAVIVNRNGGGGKHLIHPQGCFLFSNIWGLGLGLGLGLGSGFEGRV